jgi:hypothetical protein
MSIKDFFLKKMVQSQMKDASPEDQAKILKLVGDNPKFFETIANEVQASMKGGKDQMTAVLEVVTKHKDELQKMIEK